MDGHRTGSRRSRPPAAPNSPTLIQLLSWTARCDPQAESFWIVNPAAALNRSGASGRSDAATLTAIELASIVIPAVRVESIEATQKSFSAVAPEARVAVWTC